MNVNTALQKRTTRISSAPRSSSAARAPASSCSTTSGFQRVAQRAKRIPLALRAASGLGAWVDMRFGELAARLLLRLADEREEVPHLVRSEEHTSELQSRLHLVCRLL